MNQLVPDLLRTAEEAVRRLVEECRRGGRLYQRGPRAVAQVSRTGRWHLNGIAHLREVLDAPTDAETGNSKQDEQKPLAFLRDLRLSQCRC